MVTNCEGMEDKGDHWNSSSHSGFLEAPSINRRARQHYVKARVDKDQAIVATPSEFQKAFEHLSLQ